MPDYFDEKAQELIKSINECEGDSKQGWRVLKNKLKEVARDQRYTCVQAYYNCPENADPDRMILNAHMQNSPPHA